MDPNSIIITSNDGPPLYTTAEGHFFMAVPVEDVSDPTQSIINVPLILTTDGGLGGTVQLDTLDQGTVSIEDPNIMNTQNLVIRTPAPTRKQPILAPGAQLVFVSDEASGQRLIFTTNGGKLEGPYAIETQVGSGNGDVGAALTNLTFTSTQNAPQLTTLTSSFLPATPIVSTIEPISIGPVVAQERDSRVLVEDEVQPPQAGPLRCEACDIDFSHWHQKRKHDLQHLMDKPYNCKKCSSSFNHEMNFQLHEVIHLDSSAWTCPICNRNFKRLASYKAHIFVHETEESVTCELCGEEFTTQKYLDLHISEDHRDDNEQAEEITISYECTICKRIFNKRTDFKDHMKDHSKLHQSLKTTQGRRPLSKRRPGNFKCSMCEKRFPKPCLLRRHWLTHSGERPHKCGECSQAFSQRGSLFLHTLLHKGVRPYKCNFCTARFTQKGNLRSHISRTHMMPMPGETLYQCHQCPCVFKKIGPLNAHITKLHYTEKTPVAPQEEQESKKLQGEAEPVASLLNSDILQQAINQSGLQNAQSKKDEANKTEVQVIADSRLDGTTRHYQVKVRRLANVRWHQCLYCTKEFKKPSDLIRHMRTHTNEKPYKCHVCHRGFTVRSTLHVHLHTHGPQRTLQCEVCSKKYTSASSLTQHLKSHMNTKTVTCEHCNETYTYTGSRDPHQCEVLKRIALEKRRKKIMENKQLEERLKDSFPYLQDPLYVSEKGLISINRKKGSAPGRPEEYSERPYVCARCNCRFKKRSHLRAHEASHDGIKRFQCNDCGKAFTSKPAMKHHIVIMHTNQGKTYECTICNQHYTAKSCLQRHMLCHSSQKQYVCPYCEKQFAYSSACRQHIKTHAREVISNSEKSKNNLKAAVLVSKGDIMPQQQTLVELVNAVEQRTVSVINAPATQYNQLGQPILTKYSVQLADNMTADKMLITDNLASKAVAEVIPQIINANVSGLQGELQLGLIQKQSQMLGIGKPIEEFPLLEQPGVSSNQGMVPVETSIFIQGFDGQTLDPTFLTGGIPIQTDPIEMGTLTKMLASTSSTEPPHQEDLTQFSCDICKKIFIDGELYKLHYVEEHLVGCQLCDGKFETQEGLDTHVKSAHEKTPAPYKSYKCGNCGAVFGNPRQLQGHINKLHNKRSLLRKIAQTAPISGAMDQLVDAAAPKKDAVRRLTQEEANDMAKFVLSTPKPSVSEAVFLESLKEVNKKTEKEEEKIPEDIHTTNAGNNNSCHLCPKTFRKPSDLTRHIRTHTGEKPFVCTHCDKGFAVKSTLVAHWLVHKKSPASGLPCHICNAKFATKGSLRVHMRIHTGSRPLKCLYCHLNFRTSGHRKAHMAQVHKAVIKKNPLPESLLPNIIEEEGPVVEEVEEAVNALNPPEQEPSEAQMSIPINLESSELLLDDNLIHQVQSGSFVFYPPDTEGFIRFEVFSDIQGQQLIENLGEGASLVEPPQQKEPDNKSCLVCGKTFTKPSQLVRHMRIHSGEKPFPCTLCDKKFNQKNALNAHILTHTGLKKYRCDFCERSFTQAGNLKTHIRRAHPEQLQD